ncbi:MAG: hypothetical protein R3F11_31755 [Verrucomicrobiales bacterium]
MKPYLFPLLALAASIPAAPGGDWNVFRGDNAMTGVSAEDFAFPLALKWTFKAGEPVKGTAVIND